LIDDPADFVEIVSGPKTMREQLHHLVDSVGEKWDQMSASEGSTARKREGDVSLFWYHFVRPVRPSVYPI
jgi:hypothetical protein